MSPADRLPTELLLVGLDAAFDHEPILRALSRATRIPCRWQGRVAGSDVPVIEGRGQVDADAVLEQLEATATEPGVVLIGVTDRDLATPLFTFVFGRARLGGKAAVVSIARLRPEFYGLPPDPGLTVRRCVDEILHEVGHTLGLHHCRDHGCLMHFAADVTTADLRAARLCDDCAALLPA